MPVACRSKDLHARPCVPHAAGGGQSEIQPSTTDRAHGVVDAAGPYCAGRRSSSRSVLKDDVCARVAKDMPKAKDALLAIKHFPRPVVETWGDAILDLLSTVRKMDTDALVGVQSAKSPIKTARVLMRCMPSAPCCVGGKASILELGPAC